MADAHPPSTVLDAPVFLSYARQDRDFAVALYDELKAAEIPLWRDIHDIPAGAPDWWGEVRKAIEACSSMVLCMSVAALQSTVVSDEWNYARFKGKRIIPVIADEVFEHPDVKAGKVVVPVWMRNANWLDLRQDAPERDAAFANLLQTLRTPYEAQPVHITVKASQLPPNFVPRPREFEPLVRALAVDEPPTAVALTAALRGAGGYGKTVLAKALCRDLRVSGAYPDGIYWVTLGEHLLTLNPTVRKDELVARLLDLVELISGWRPGVQELVAAQEKLAEAVAGKRCLIVVDDVWAETHVKPFLVPGKHHATVITTRFDECVPGGSGVFRQKVDQMAEQDALNLLAYDVEGWEEQRKWFEQTAKRLGYSAQLLGIINGAIIRRLRGDDGRPYTLVEALQYIDERLDYYGVTAFDAEDPEQREKAFGRTLEVGIEALKPVEQQRYRELGIFPEDVPIPLTSLAGLWGLDAIPTQDFCQKLARSSLVQDYDERSLTVHDVTLKYLQQTLVDAPVVHARLLDAWGGGWEALPDDYAWDHYAYHLLGAGRDDALLALFADQRWKDARFKDARFKHDRYTYSYSGYIADLMLAWEQVAHPRAVQQIEAGGPVMALVDCARLALIRTSINSLAANYVPAVVARAVELGMWKVERALSIAERVPDPAKRAEMYTAILQTSKLDEQQRTHAGQQALAAARRIADEEARAEVLVALAPYLPEGLLGKALEAARAIEWEPARARALGALAPHLLEGLLGETLEAARRIEREFFCAEVLLALAPYLPEGLLGEALEAARRIERESDRARTLVALAPYLPEGLLGEALEAARRIEWESDRAEVLVALAPHLPGGQRQEVLRDALVAARRIANKHVRARVLGALAEQLPEGQRREVLGEVLEAARRIEREFSRAKVLEALAPYLPEGLLGEALEAARRIADEEARAEALVALAPYLPEGLLGEALEAARRIADESDRARTLVALAPYLPEGLLGEALEAARVITDESDRARTLEALAPYLPEGLLGEALEAARRIEREDARAEVVVALAPYLPEGLVGEALEAAFRIELKFDRAKALMALAARLPKMQRYVLGEALAAARRIEWESDRAEALVALAPYLPEGLLGEALAAARAIADEAHRADVLAALAEQMEREQRLSVLGEALEAARRIERESDRAEVLVALAPYLPEGLLGEALAAARAIADEAHRADVLAALAEQMEGEQRLSVLKEILSTVVQGLLDLQHTKRDAVLRFLAKDAFYPAEMVPTETVGRVAAHIGEICNVWRWE
ncbi:MAG: hypothetical protein Kow0077_22380 [Anaerolineae bacterium]